MTTGSLDSLVPDDDGEPPSRAWLHRSGGCPLPPELDPVPQHPAAEESATGFHPSVANGVSDEINAGVGWIAGGAIALFTLFIPISSVVLDRTTSPKAAHPVSAGMNQSLSVGAPAASGHSSASAASATRSQGSAQ